MCARQQESKSDPETGGLNISRSVATRKKQGMRFHEAGRCKVIVRLFHAGPHVPSVRSVEWDAAEALSVAVI
jgi:hypothetical protein